MKICHITTVHPVQDARIFHRMCRALAAKQTAVVLIAPGSFNPEDCLGPSRWNDALERASRMQRIRLALKAALSEDADICHFHDPELIPMGLLLKARKPHKAVVYDVHEDYPSMMRDKHWLPKWTRPAAAAAARCANQLAARCFDGIVVADRGVAEEFAGRAAHKTLVHYNFPRLDLFVRDAVKPAPAADLVYVGGLNERTGIFVLFDALKILARCSIKPTVNLAGYTDGEAGLTELNAALCRYELGGQVRFYGRLPHHDVPDFLRAGRAGLVLLQPVPKFMKNIPTKMFEYWACGLPVIASDLPPIRQFLVDGQHGCLFDPKKPAELAERIAFLMSHPQQAQALGENGRRMVETQWNNESQTDALLEFYRRICARTAGAARRKNSAAPQWKTAVPAKELSEPADWSER
jgi:glycosyltransferase involved in cell wall biosynthesis